MMQKILLICSLALFSCASFPMNMPQAAYISSQRNVSHLQNSTVALVETENAPEGVITDTLGLENEAYCTGFFIDPVTIVTANHCTTYDETQRVTINSSGGIQIESLTKHIKQVKVATYEFYQDRLREDFDYYVLFDLVGYSEINDVAILRLHDTQDQAFQRESLCLSNLTPHAGNPVFTIGHPVGEYYVLTEGIISRESYSEYGGRWVSATADIYFGNSGGPLVDNRGCVLGVTHAITAHQSHLGTWADVYGIKRLLMSLHYVLQTTRY